MDHQTASQYVKDRLWPMLTVHWCFWIPCHTLNFWKTPVRHRLLPAQVFATVEMVAFELSSLELSVCALFGRLHCLDGVHLCHTPGRKTDLDSFL